MIGKIVVIALIALIVVVGYTLSGMYGNTYEIKGTVVKTWIDPTDGGSAYVVKVRLEDGRQKMLEVKRNFNFMGVNEDILFSNIEINKTYTFKCWGWDVESFWIFSLYWYPNIIAIQEII